MATRPQSTSAADPTEAVGTPAAPSGDSVSAADLADALAALDALREMLAPDLESPAPRVGVLATAPAADFVTALIRHEVRARSRGARVVAVEGPEAVAGDLDILLTHGIDPPAGDTAAVRLDADGAGPLALAARLVDADEMRARAAALAARGVPGAADGAVCLVVDDLDAATLGAVVGAVAELERDLGRPLPILPAELDPEVPQPTLALMRHLGLPALTPRATGPEETLAAIALCPVVVGTGPAIRALAGAAGRAPVDPLAEEAGARIAAVLDDPAVGAARADEAALDRLLDAVVDSARAAAARHRPTRTAQQLAQRADELVDHVAGLERARASAVTRLAEERRELTAFAERMRRAAEESEERARRAEETLRAARERTAMLESALAHTGAALSQLQHELASALATARADLAAQADARTDTPTALRVLRGLARRLRALARR